MAVADLGLDFSGNGNYWTPVNFSVTAGVGNDSLVDTPTPYGTDTGAGGEVRGNYCTMNPLTVATLPTLANGNLDVSVSATGVKIAQGTYQFPSSGKWYYECTFNNASSGVNGMFIGITSPTRGPNVTRSTAGAYFFYASSSGLLSSNGTDLVTGLSAISANEVFKVAVDIDNSKVWIGRGSTWYNSSGGTTGDPAAGTNPTFSISASGLTPMSGFDASSVSLSMNFGQRTWAQTCPSGFKALCTQNLPTPTIGATSTTQANRYFDVVTRSGFGSSGGSVATNFQADLIWEKPRNSATSHYIVDAVRGITSGTAPFLSSNTTSQEQNANWFNAPTTSTISFNSNDWGTSTTLVDWIWKANGSGSTNTAGTITSTVSANTTSGFSIVNWSGSTSTSAQTVGHGLGVTPKMVILKNRDLVDNWFVWFSGITSNSQNLYLNTTAALTTQASALWGAGMTSTLCGVRPNSFVNTTNDDVIMYVFAEVAGYSKFGSYTGNGSTDGPFVYCGFRPRYILWKVSSGTTGHWEVVDTARETYNQSDQVLFASSSGAESAASSSYYMDILSNGFKIRNTDTSQNGNTYTYIYAAFAETPFAYSLAR